MAEPALQGARQNRALDVAIFELAGHFGLEVAGRQCIYADPLASRPLLGEIARQTDQPGFRCRVCGLWYPGTGQAEHARDVDDAAPSLHHPGTFLGHPVTPVEVDVDDGSKLFGRFPGRRYRGADAGVVDQYVDPAEGAHGGVDELTAVVGAGHIGPHRNGPPAGVLDKFAGGHQAVLSTRAQRHVGSRLGEGDGERDT